jgi:hypothetical protein
MRDRVRWRFGSKHCKRMVPRRWRINSDNLCSAFSLISRSVGIGMSFVCCHGTW